MPHQLNSRLFFKAADWQFGSESEEFSIRAGLVTAGAIRNGANQKTRMVVPWEVLLDALGRGLFDDLACFVNHSSFFAMDEMNRLAGTWRKPEADETAQQITAVLKFYDNTAGKDAAATFRSIGREVAIGDNPPDVGVSLDFYGEFERGEDDRIYLSSIVHVRSADLVFMPATESRVKHGALSASYIISKEATMPVQITEENAPEQQPVQHLATAEEIFDFEPAQNMMAEILRQGAQTLIQMSGLPTAVQETLLQRSYGSAEDVNTAIAEARGIGAAFVESQTVQMNGHGRRDVQMTTPLDSAQNIMDYMFGVADAPLPEPEMRSLKHFYIHLTGDGDFWGTFQPDRVKFAGATTADLPNLAKNAMNKVIIAQWEGAALKPYRWFETVVSLKPNDGSVHDIEFISWGGTGDLPVVAEKGAYTEGTPGDASESAAFAKRGRYVGITLEMFRNSDIQRLQLVPRSLAKDALRTRSGQVAGLFTQAAGVGPNLSDGNPLFHASGNNVATTALDKAGWKAARLEAYSHVEVGSGKKLGIWPKYCLVSGDQFDDTLELFGYGHGTPTSYEAYAEARGLEDPRAVPISVPEWTDANDWAYLDDPDLWETICMSYANDPSGRSHPMPELFTVTSELVGLMFTNDTMPVKVRDWWALGLTGRQGIGKRNVA